MQDLPRCLKAYSFQSIFIQLMVSKDLDTIPADVGPEDPQHQVAHGRAFFGESGVFDKSPRPRPTSLGCSNRLWPIQADAFQTLLDMGFASRGAIAISAKDG
jgi:hypothetical protein